MTTALPPELAALDQRFDIDTRDVTIAGRAWRLDRPRNSDDLISEADYVMDERLPYWADLWASSIVLAGEVITIRGAGKTAIELGCGLGLPSMAAAAAGYAVTATDYYEDATLFARRNALINVGHDIGGRHLDWSALPDDLPRYNLVMTADVLYEPRYATLVSRAVTRLIAPGGVALVADPGRIALEEFRDECHELGATVEPRCTVVHDDGEKQLTVTIHEVRLG